MLASDAVVIVGRVTLDKLGLNLNDQMFQLAGVQRTGQVTGVENTGYLSTQRVMLSVYASQNGQGEE